MKTFFVALYKMLLFKKVEDGSRSIESTLGIFGWLMILKMILVIVISLEQ